MSGSCLPTEPKRENDERRMRNVSRKGKVLNNIAKVWLVKDYKFKAHRCRIFKK